MAELKSLKGGYYVWYYVPSIAAAVVFCILFLIATFLHFWKIYKTRAWFCIAFAIGCLFEVVGYGARASAADKTDKVMPYVIQNIFILLGPALFAASIYMTLSRVILSVKGEHLSLIRTNWLTKVFVTGDVISFVVQGGAGGLMAAGNGKHMKLGENIIIGGLMIQVIMFCFFGITATVFHMRIRKNPTRETFEVKTKWEQYLYMLYVVSAFIMVRSIFRVIEFSMGHDGYLLKNEWTLYLFDAVLMWLVTIIFFWRYPNDVIGSKRKDFGNVQLRSFESKA